jgi:ABC-type transport system involved in cytochrome c biogenesis permease subunit
LGILIMAAEGAYVLACALLACRLRKAGHGFFAVGFATAVAAFVLRWIQVEHLPMQNLFEVFLSMGMMMYPITLFCRKYLKVGGEAGDALIGAILLFMPAFIKKFSPEPQVLPPALQSPLFAPHVVAYLLAYVIMAKASVQAIQTLRRPEPTAADEGLLDTEAGAYRMVGLGFPLLTLGLVLGAWWGKVAWGDYWQWDPKELWSLVSWLLFLFYLHVRNRWGARHRVFNSSLVVAGLLAILITLLWANLSALFKGMHSYAT